MSNKKGKLVEKVEAVDPGFINFWLTKEWLTSELSQVNYNGEKYGSSDWGKGKRWLIEHTSPNPNKAMHLGHLRNNVTGMAIANIWKFVGVDVIRDAIDNDRGIAIARLMWGYLKFGRKDKKEDKPDINYWHEHQEEWLTPKAAGLRPDRFVDELYVKASEDFKNSKEVEEKVRQMVVDWENKDEKHWALWEKVLAYSYEGQDLTLHRLGSIWDKVWHEHEHFEQGKEMVKLGLKKGIFRVSEDKTILTNLEKYNLPDTVVIKSDGTALYITQDLALTKLKRETYKPDHLYWVIGPEQTLQLKQLFAVCEQLGIGKVPDFTHIAFGWMSIKGQGKMSSRTGNVVYIDDLIDLAKEEVKAIMKEGDKGRNENPDEIAENVALGAVKYSILKVGRLMDTAFSFEESLTFEGDSGPYLQYTYARAKSVLRKAQSNNLKFKIYNLNSNFKIQNSNLTTEELAILRYLYRFPEVVEQAARSYSPNLICTYLFELAQRFNNFYNNVPILDTTLRSVSASQKPGLNNVPILKSESAAFKLSLVEATSIVLQNGLNLLGIKALERM